MRSINNIITQDQRNAIYVFGQPDRLAAAERLRKVSDLMQDMEAGIQIRIVSEEVKRISSETWLQDFYTIRHRKETIMNYMVAIYQEDTGDATPRPWKPFAMQQILGTFGSENQPETIKRLEAVKSLTVEPMIVDATGHLLTTLQFVHDKRPILYGGILEAARDSLHYHCYDDNEVYARIMKEGRYGKAE